METVTKWVGWGGGDRLRSLFRFHSVHSPPEEDIQWHWFGEQRGSKAVGNEEAYLPNPFRQSTSCAPTHFIFFYRRSLPQNGDAKARCSELTPTRAEGGGA